MNKSYAMAACLKYLLVITPETVRKEKNVKFARKNIRDILHGYKLTRLKEKLEMVVRDGEFRRNDYVRNACDGKA